MKHIQLEPVWGGTSDTAATLRGTCAVALVQCRNLSDTELLAQLIELFADKEKSVRVAAVQTIEQVGSASSALLLRLKAVAGSNEDEPEVLGACYGGVLRLEGAKAIPWVAHFLDAGDDSAAEAALALAAMHSVAAFNALRERYNQVRDPWFRSVLLSAIALTRQEEALEFLFEMVRTESPHAVSAVEAIVRSLPSQEVTSRLETLVAGNQRLALAFATHRATSTKTK
jgi:HEAT repeat protein